MVLFVGKHLFHLTASKWFVIVWTYIRRNHNLKHDWKVREPPNASTINEMVKDEKNFQSKLNFRTSTFSNFVLQESNLRIWIFQF